MTRNARGGRKAEVSETTPVPIDKDVRLRGQVRCECGDISFEKNVTV